MPIEIKELVVRAVVSGADMESAKKIKRTKSGDSKERKQIAEMLEQMKQMMLDHKER